MTSSTTCPSSTSTVKSTNSPPDESPRNTFIATSGTDLHLLLDQRPQLRWHLRKRLPHDHRLLIRAHAHGDIDSTPITARLWVVVASVRPSALLALDRRKRDRLRNAEHGAQVDR